MGIKRAGLLLSLLVLTSSSTLVSIAAAYGGWPTVSGRGSYTADIIDPDTYLPVTYRCGFTFRVRAFKDTIRGSLEVLITNDAEVLTLHATTFTDLSITPMRATIAGIGVLSANGASLPVVFTVEIGDNGLDEYFGVSFGPSGVRQAVLNTDGSDYAGRITIKC
jgi:hypothetical protein